MKTKREKEIKRYYRNEDKIERKKDRKRTKEIVKCAGTMSGILPLRRERERVLFFAKI
jgi:hypothetical protein